MKGALFLGGMITGATLMLCAISFQVGVEKMPDLQPVVRVILILFAGVIAGLAAVQDSLPLWAQAAIAGLSVAIAGLGIIPPQVGARTYIPKEPEK